jgi:hypothetical protein
MHMTHPDVGMNCFRGHAVMSRHKRWLGKCAPNTMAIWASGSVVASHAGRWSIACPPWRVTRHCSRISYFLLLTLCVRPQNSEIRFESATPCDRSAVSPFSSVSEPPQSALIFQRVSVSRSKCQMFRRDPGLSPGTAAFAIVLWGLRIADTSSQSD